MGNYWPNYSWRWYLRRHKEAVAAVCRQLPLRITQQPINIFLLNWLEKLSLCTETKVQEINAGLDFNFHQNLLLCGGEAEEGAYG